MENSPVSLSYTSDMASVKRRDCVTKGDWKAERWQNFRKWISKDEFKARMTINLRGRCGDSELNDMKGKADDGSEQALL
jgi:hypothetical protein